VKSIYGLFDSDGKCRYVGLTANPSKREQQHSGKQLSFRVLRVCWVDGIRLEQQIIRAYIRKGQCDLNATVNPEPRKPKIQTLEQFMAMARRAGRKGGLTRARNLSPERRREIARLGGLAAAK
jgi:hypothetical protein